MSRDEVAIVSDLHAHPWQEFAKPNERGINDRLAHCVDVLYEVIDYCLAHHIWYIVFGGDLFHQRGVLYTQTYNLVAAALYRAKRAGIHVVADPGNHDYGDRIGSVHAMQALRESGLLVCPDGSDSQTYETDAGLVSMFAYCDGKDQLQRLLDAEERHVEQHYRGAPRISVFHHGFKGARVGSALEQIVKEEIDGRLLTGYRNARVFSGHYHTRQPIEGVDRGMYIGAPLEHSRSNRVIDNLKHPKGFLVYSFAHDTVKVVPIKRPRFVVLRQAELDALDFSLAAGNYVDVQYDEYRGGEEQLKRDLQEAGALGIKPLPSPKAKLGTAKQRIEVDPTLDPREVMKRYVAKVPPPEGFTQAELLEVGLELWNAAEE